jgi:hypothetical protein
MRTPGFDAEASVYRTSNTYRGAYAILAGNVPANKHSEIVGAPLPLTLSSDIQPVSIFALGFPDGFLMSASAATLARSTTAAARAVNCDDFCTIAYAFCPVQRQNCINICNSQCAPNGLEPCVVGSGLCPVTRCKCGDKCCKLGDVCCGRMDPVGSPGKCCPEDRCCVSLNHPDGECCSPDVRCTARDGCCRAGRIPCGRVGDVFRECCPWGKICRNGQCVCPTGQTPCGEGCCAPGEFCQDGVVCTPCPPDSTPCGSRCCPPGASVCCTSPSDRPYCCLDGQTCCNNELLGSYTCCIPGSRCCPSSGGIMCCHQGEICDPEVGCI